MIAITGHLDVDAAVRDRLPAGTADLQQSTQDNEPGCRVYTIAGDPTHSGRVRITELWESADALESHFAHPNLATTGAALQSEEWLGGSFRKYRIDAEADLMGSDGAPSTIFD